MTPLELMQSKTDDELCDLLDHAAPVVAAMARSVLDARAASETPRRPGRCTCCGAGLRQWR
jgi:hypothetical protein